MEESETYCINVVHHKNQATWGPQPVFLNSRLCQAMDNYYQKWRSQPYDEEEAQFFFINSRGKCLRNRGLTSIMKVHFARHEISIPENFTTTAVRTAASTDIQETEGDELKNQATRIFLHSRGVQEASYRERLHQERLAYYKDNITKHVSRNVCSK